MAEYISFTDVYRYSDDEPGITLPVVLHHGGLIYITSAKVDTGSEVCLFSREVGEDLGLIIENGILLELNSLGGRVEAFGHEVLLQTEDLAFTSFVYFSKYPVRRNLLGRQGWLRQIRIAIVDYDNLLYLSRYDE
ncbi:MAG: hypothetical protein ACKVZH_12030 [Blastocatellia bacterium]